ncbi:MFS transporter [Bifidobacterium pullorum subsp. saeculare]|uniref:MFS transporter n=1 Tax=Bifidobacterium pullorum subsp. saeculare TaxID=78257 RepID=A0A939BAC2_9BIFI|nr:MFS transporter [Bifidobacterium pullorum]MBM6700175.1 MFS transporter [Bifidobacterium pullorum subsp. saeculare]
MSKNQSRNRGGRGGGAIVDLGRKLFGGYAELLRIPHTARYAIGSVIACMPFPMVGMTITISVQHYYGNYSLAGALTAVQAICLAVASPLLGKLVDKFGQRQVSIPTIIVWIVAAVAITTAITNRAPEWVLFCLVPFLAAIPPWGAMSRSRWTTLLKGDGERTNRALSLSGVFDECMWVVGNPLASTLAVISGLLAMSFTGLCVVVGALMFLTELSTEPPSQTVLAKRAGMTRKEYREHEAVKAAALKAETLAEEVRRREQAKGSSPEQIQAAIATAMAEQATKPKESIWGPGLIAVCVTWFSLGAFQSATSISIIAFATEQDMKQYTGFVFACFSFSSLIGALVYGAKNWQIPLWKRFYFCLAVVNLGIGSFMFAKHLWVIMLIYLLIGVCQSPTWINGNQLMLHLVPPSRFTEGVAWMGAMNSIGSSCGSAIAGQFIDRFGSHGGFVVVTVLALSSLVIAFVGFKQIKASTEEPTLTEVHV